MSVPRTQTPATSLIERYTAVTQSTDKDVFTNTHALFQAPGYRGIYGGATISHSLSAAQKTVPPEFYAHTLHCSFVAAGQSDSPITYRVRRVRDGKNFVHRQVEAQQKGKTIFTATLSFVRDGSEGREKLEHAVNMPTNVIAPPDYRSEGIDEQFPPFESIRYPLLRLGSALENRERQWMRARGRLPDDPHVHQSALAYMSDSYLVGAIARVHGAKDSPSNRPRSIQSKMLAFPGSASDMQEMRRYLESIRFGSVADTVSQVGEEVVRRERKKIDFVVSLNHSMYFHRPSAFRTDEWMLTETEVPWTGGGRGLVTQRIWGKNGHLIATCTQEGLVRLHNQKDEKL